MEVLAGSGERELGRLGRPLREPLERALAGRGITRAEAVRLLQDRGEDSLRALLAVARRLRELGHGHTVSYSPKVFIPLTRLCRDLCRYCTFRQEPEAADGIFLTLEEVLAVARAGERAGCGEALFTLGERPEQRYPEARAWLARRGYRSTHEYLRDMCELVLRETRLLPHANPGTLTEREFEMLRDVNASMGMMLESVSKVLCGPGGPHELAPSKHPRARLRTLERAGRARVAFTTGILVGIGETPEDRVDSLFAIRELHEIYGHIQEVIVQNFRPKPGTPMAGHPGPERAEFLRLVGVARLVLGPEMNLQVPPNLSGEDFPLHLLAGINDWGGISPVTIDYVNPEAPWPHVARLRQATRAFGLELKARLPIYPEYLTGRPEYVPEPVRTRAARLVDADGFLKGGP